MRQGFVKRKIAQNNKKIKSFFCVTFCLTKCLKHDTMNTSKGTTKEREENEMAVIKKDGFVVGVEKVDAERIKALEANGFVVILK